jgi:hypothetical protein
MKDCFVALFLPELNIEVAAGKFAFYDSTSESFCSPHTFIICNPNANGLNGRKGAGRRINLA